MYREYDNRSILYNANILKTFINHTAKTTPSTAALAFQYEAITRLHLCCNFIFYLNVSLIIMRNKGPEYFRVHFFRKQIFFFAPKTLFGCFCCEKKENEVLCKNKMRNEKE